MSDQPATSRDEGRTTRGSDADIAGSLPGVVVRSGIGGVLMGLANLVPGISGGTMLLAAGVYRAFIGAIADVSVLRLRVRSLVVLASVVGAALAAIVLLAGPVKVLVLDHRWVMYSLFIGLTLGGVPLVWGMLKNTGGVRTGAAVGFGVGVALMAVLAFAKAGGGAGGGGMVMLFVAGIAGASAMILPGVSGAYLLLVLGQYVPILASVGRLKDALSAGDIGAAAAEWNVVVPVGVGVVVGVAGLSTLIRWCLHHREGPTLGVLLGLLVGSVLGLWPFQRTVEPMPGDTLKGQTVIEVAEVVGEDGEPTGEIVATTEIDEIGREDWPLETFAPTTVQIASSAGLALLGFGVTMGIARFGRVKEPGERTE